MTKRYLITVPILAEQDVIVEAKDVDEAKEMVLKGDIVAEASEIRFVGVNEEGDWKIQRRNDEAKVDLKWSLWSTDKSNWDDRAPGTWDAMANLEVGETFGIFTAPKKEIRYGTVAITRFEESWLAHGYFEETWDSVTDLCDTLGIPEEQEYEMHEVLPYTDSGEVGACRHFDVTAPTFEELMKAVDDEEAKLIEESHELWEEVEKTYGKKKDGDDT